MLIRERYADFGPTLACEKLRERHGLSLAKETVRVLMMAAAPLWVPDRRDIIWIDFNPQAGREMKDLHPMMVLSPKPFSDRTSIVIGLPMTTAEFNDSNPFAIKFLGPKGVVTCLFMARRSCTAWRRTWAQWSSRSDREDLDQINEEVSRMQVQGERLPEVALKMTGR